MIARRTEMIGEMGEEIAGAKKRKMRTVGTVLKTRADGTDFEERALWENVSSKLSG